MKCNSFFALREAKNKFLQLLNNIFRGFIFGIIEPEVQPLIETISHREIQQSPNGLEDNLLLLMLA